MSEHDADPADPRDETTRPRKPGDDWTWSGRLPAPDFTMVPNIYLREISPHLSGGEAKVMNYLIAETYGWHRAAVSKSLEEIRAGAGVARQTAVTALAHLEEMRLIGVVRSITDKGRDANQYNVLIAADPKYKNCTTPIVQKLDHKPVQKLDFAPLYK